MSRYLIVNADDFGHTMGVSEGVLRAHQDGIVTSTTVMINRPAAAESIRIARRDAPVLGLGLHLNLTSGKPVLPAERIPALVQADGSFHRPPLLVPMLQLSAIDMTQVEQELRAQIDLFVQLAGAAPDHLDSHHHITYASPGIAAVMLQLAADLDVPIRNAFPKISGAQDDTTTNERKDMPHDDSAWKDLLARSQVRMPHPLMDAFYDEHATLGDLLNVLMDTSPDGVSELMCHPAVPDDDLRAESVYADRRGDELEALTHPSVLELVAAVGIELITFRRFSGNRSPKQ